MAILFRKWMVPAWNRRAGKASYSYQADEWTEGYYISFGRFAKQLIKDGKALSIRLLMEDFSKLSDIEKSNIRRALTELGIFASLSMLLAFADFPDDDWFSKFLEYQARRLQTEVGAMTPSPAIFS